MKKLNARDMVETQEEENITTQMELCRTLLGGSRVIRLSFKFDFPFDGSSAFILMNIMNVRSGETDLSRNA